MHKIFFYPHPNLRDRQLDTVRLWPKENVINPEIADQKPWHYPPSLTLRKVIPKSWHQYIPALNIKRRPWNAPKDAIVYCWGGIISHGDFIIELDNPYIMTAYNVRAFRLYKVVLRSLLLSPRCRQIRCISAACRETLRMELGEDVAAKASVFYPLISDLKADHVPQPAGDVPKLLFISTSFLLKAGPSVLRVMQKLADEKISCHLSLITYLPEAYKGLAENLPNVTVIPANQPRSELVHSYQTHDLILHPTFMESFGMVVWEALAYGMAIIANDVYAIREMVTEKNGSLVPAPFANWKDAKPTEFFAQTQKTQDLAASGNTAEFETRLFNEIKYWVQDRQRLSMAKFESQKHYRDLSLQPAYFTLPA